MDSHTHIEKERERERILTIHAFIGQKPFKNAKLRHENM